MIKKIITTLTIIVCASMMFHSCVKQKFDSPPDTTTQDPNLPVNTNIWALKQMYVNAPIQITSDAIIGGVVVADDRSGNFYKTIIIQDDSSGIAIKLGANGLYNDYPIGRKVYVKCKGLYLGAYGNFVQLGGAPDASGSLSDIPSNLIAQYVVKGKYPVAVTPLPVTISQISNVSSNLRLLGMLIKIDSCEFSGADAGQPYAEPASISSGTDREIADCSNNVMVVRNSGYATFQSYLTPTGRGNLTAIYSRYNSSAQLLIRDTMDCKMYGPRCSSLLTLVTIKNIRDLFTGTATTVPTGYKIKGVVISDKANGNINSQNIVLQDGSNKGIVVRFSASHPFLLNDEVEVNISGQPISEYNGVLQVGGTSLSTANGFKTGTGSITARPCNIQQINDSLEVWESTLVKVTNATLSGTHTHYYDAGASGGAGNLTMNDGTGSITHYTASTASFVGTTYPTTPKIISGIVGQYNTTKQISIRNTAIDVQ